MLKSYLQNKHFLIKRRTARQFPWAITLSTTHRIPTNLTRNYISNLFRRHSSNSHRKWSAIASCKLQTNLLAIQSWLATWRMKVNGSKATHITFTRRRGTCPPVHINNIQLPQTVEVKYLGLHLDRRLTWHKHIFTKRNQLGITLTEMYWLLGLKSKLYK
jgi:hypothetical protein